MLRRVLLIALWFLVGAVVNVGVGWTIAVAPAPASAGQFAYYLDWRWIVLGQRSGISCIAVHTLYRDSGGVPEQVRRNRQVELFASEFNANAPAGLLADEASLDSIIQRFHVEVDRAVVVAVGWPMCSMQSRTLACKPGPPVPATSAQSGDRVADACAEFDVGLDVRRFVCAVPWHPLGEVLPVRPLRPAFALNTCFYTLLTWSLVRGLQTLRRWRRRRAGWCIACGYDLKGLAEGAPCPECGRAIGSSASRRRGARVAAGGATRI